MGGFFMKRFLVFLVSTFIVSTTVAFSQYYQAVQGKGGVDWTDQIVRATGIGSPNPDLPAGAQRSGAIEAAKRIALRNLLEMVKGMNLNSEVTIENAMVSSDEIRTSVEGVVRNFKVVDTRYMSTGDIEVDVEVPLSGFLDLVIPEEAGHPLYCPTCGQKWPAGVPYPFGNNPPGNAVPPTASAGTTGRPGALSGLIIDARGLNLHPALAPKILDELGNEIYGSGFVSREYAVKIGVVGYEKDLNRARTNKRVAGNPIIVRAVRAAGTNQTDIIISNADAQKIRTAAAHNNFLAQSRVMIVL